MTTGIAGRAVRACGLAAAFAGLALGLVTAVAPPRAAVAAQKDEKKAERKYPKAPESHELIRASGCQQCHNELKPEGNPLYKKTLGYQFVRLRENLVWDAHDLHSTAYKSLLTDRTLPKEKGDKDGLKANLTAQRMENKLRRYKGDSYTVAGDVACLACHASTTEPIRQVPPDKWAVTSFETSDGVGCEMCHGHGSSYRFKHQETDRTAAVPEGAKEAVGWREWDPTEKQKWGLINLRDPAVATHTCASCHIGNKDEGRFVTHDMFAAGHPPLPPLDLLAYAREQPRHWGFADEMPYIVQLAKNKDTAGRAFALYHYRDGESFVARRFAESAIAALGATATLGAQLADDAKAKQDGLDFSAFDCYSCHHNLKYPSERQERGYVGRPGRPLYRPAAFALARLVLEHAGGLKGGEPLKGAAAELDELEKGLADAFTVKTYGDPGKVKEATEKLAKWTVAAGKKLEPVRYDRDSVAALLQKIITAGADKEKPVGDPEVAQLYTWAVETLYLDLVKPTEAEIKKKEGPAALTTLTNSIQNSVVARLRPKTPFYYEQGIDTPFDGKTNDKDSVEGRIKERMDVFNSFQGDPFRKAFGALKVPAPK